MNTNKSKDWHIKMAVIHLRIKIIVMITANTISIKLIKIWIILWIAQYKKITSTKTSELVEVPLHKCSKNRGFTTMKIVCSQIHSIWKKYMLIILMGCIHNLLINCLKMKNILMFIKAKIILIEAVEAIKKLPNINKIWKTQLNIIEDKEWKKTSHKSLKFIQTKNSPNTKNTVKISKWLMEILTLD